MREDWALVVGEQPYKEARGTRGPDSPHVRGPSLLDLPERGEPLRH
jgi:hypothetical protein